MAEDNSRTGGATAVSSTFHLYSTMQSNQTQDSRRRRAMKLAKWFALGVLASLLLALLVPVGAQTGSSVEVEAGWSSPYRGVSGPVEQGELAFWRSPYVPVGRTGVSGPVEQGDPGFFRAPYVPVGETGISGPVEQGDLAFWRSPYVPVGRTGVSGPVEQGDAGFE